MTTRIELENGKYTVCHDNGTNFRALRHGEEWRSLAGDGLVLAMAQRIEELEETCGGQLLTLIAARNAWGDYLPHGSSTAAKVMKSVDAAIERGKGAA